MKQKKMKFGDKIIGDCDNCFDNVELEFHYKESGIYTFVCCKCGKYNHKNKDEVQKNGKTKT